MACCRVIFLLSLYTSSKWRLCSGKGKISCRTFCSIFYHSCGGVRLRLRASVASNEPTVQSLDDRWMYFETPVEGWWRGKTEIFGEKRVQVPLSPLQTHRLPWYQIQFSTVRRLVVAALYFDTFAYWFLSFPSELLVNGAPISIIQTVFPFEPKHLHYRHTITIKGYSANALF